MSFPNLYKGCTAQSSCKVVRLSGIHRHLAANENQVFTQTMGILFEVLMKIEKHASLCFLPNILAIASELYIYVTFRRGH